MPDSLSAWPELKGVRIAILPVGSLEQHGHHLPMGTDAIIAATLAKEIADLLEGAYLLPLLPFSSSFEHSGFPGAVSLKVATLASIISDILNSLALSDIRKLIIVNGHMGNHVLRNIVQELNSPEPRVMLAPSARQWERAYQAAGISAATSSDMHAGEGETSIILHVLPRAVKTGAIEDVEKPAMNLLETLGMSPYTNTGAIGFPSRGSAEKGKLLIEALTGEIMKVVKEFISIGKV